MSEFTSGQKVKIKPWTFHNTTDEPIEATFVSYMAGREYAVVFAETQRLWDKKHFNLRVSVEDLEA